MTIDSDKLTKWLEQEVLEDEGAMIIARDSGDWNRYHSLEGHKMAMLSVKQHIPHLPVVVPDDGFVPGCYECPKCGFGLTKNLLHVGSGTISAEKDIGIPERCPNDGTILNRETWKSRATGLAKMLEDRIRECTHLRERTDHAVAQEEKVRALNNDLLKQVRENGTAAGLAKLHKDGAVQMMDDGPTQDSELETMLKHVLCVFILEKATHAEIDQIIANNPRIESEMTR